MLPRTTLEEEGRMDTPWLADAEIERLSALDRAHFFHAATPLREHARTGPRIFVRACTTTSSTRS